MKLNVYAIFDTAAAVYKQPFMMRTDGEAVRGFMDLCIRDGNEINSHPEHFSLYKLGKFDDSTGKYSDNVLECLMTAHEAVAKSQEPLEPGALEAVN
jgi:hypothetical protein